MARATAAEVAGELRVSSDDPRIARMLTAYDALLSRVIGTTDVPDDVEKEALIRAVAYAYDQPIGPGTTWAAVLRNSGALSLLSHFLPRAALSSQALASNVEVTNLLRPLNPDTPVGPALTAQNLFDLLEAGNSIHIEIVDDKVVITNLSTGMGGMVDLAPIRQLIAANTAAINTNKTEIGRNSTAVVLARREAAEAKRIAEAAQIGEGTSEDRVRQIIYNEAPLVNIFRCFKKWNTGGIEGQWYLELQFNPAKYDSWKLASSTSARRVFKLKVNIAGKDNIIAVDDKVLTTTTKTSTEIAADISAGNTVRWRITLYFSPAQEVSIYEAVGDLGVLQATASLVNAAETNKIDIGTFSVPIPTPDLYKHSHGFFNIDCAKMDDTPGLEGRWIVNADVQPHLISTRWPQFLHSETGAPLILDIGATFADMNSLSLTVTNDDTGSVPINRLLLAHSKRFTFPYRQIAKHIRFMLYVSKANAARIKASLPTDSALAPLVVFVDHGTLDDTWLVAGRISMRIPQAGSASTTPTPAGADNSLAISNTSLIKNNNERNTKGAWRLDFDINPAKYDAHNIDASPTTHYQFKFEVNVEGQTAVIGTRSGSLRSTFTTNRILKTDVAGFITTNIPLFVTDLVVTGIGTSPLLTAEVYILGATSQTEQSGKVRLGVVKAPVLIDAVSWQPLGLALTRNSDGSRYDMDAAGTEGFYNFIKANPNKEYLLVISNLLFSGYPSGGAVQLPFNVKGLDVSNVSGSRRARLSIGSFYDNFFGVSQPCAILMNMGARVEISASVFTSDTIDITFNSQTTMTLYYRGY